MREVVPRTLQKPPIDRPEFEEGARFQTPDRPEVPFPHARDRGEGGEGRDHDDRREIDDAPSPSPLNARAAASGNGTFSFGDIASRADDDRQQRSTRLNSSHIPLSRMPSSA